MATLSVGGSLVTTNDTLSNGVQDNITRLGTVTTGTMNNTIGSSATFPAGHVLQVTTGEASGGGTHSSISDWVTIHSHAITPLSSTSDIMIWFSGGIGISGTPTVPIAARVIRGSTVIGVSSAQGGTSRQANTVQTQNSNFSANDRMNAFAGHYMDKTRSSGTSEITYNMQVSPRSDGGSWSFRVGSIYNSATGGYVFNVLQVITAMEVEAA
jgi:hypothetical protein